jgi:nucleotide-binding universal stress UspA family protein
MFHTILAGCDGFERGRRAAAMAEALTEATGGRLLLVAAYAQAPVPPPDGYRAQRARMDHAIRAVRDEVAPHAVTSTVAALSPSHALRHVARHEHADLVVVGSHRRHGVGHLVDANHAMQVVHDAPCPVMVVPDGPADVALRRISVGFDGSPEARAALEVAADLARRAGASLSLRVVVPEPLPAWPLGWGLVPPADETLGVEAARREAADLLAATLRGLDGVDAAGEVAVGDPADALIRTSGQADLLVVGSRRWGALRRVLLGSTSERLARHCEGPVLIVPRPASAGEPTERPQVHATAP